MNTHEPANVTVARILRPHGRRGEVACEILTDFPERLTKLTSVFLWDGASAPRPSVVRSCWLSQSRGGQAIFHFAGIDTISAAEKLVGLDVQILLVQRLQLPSGSYYVTDLIACRVQGHNGITIGSVRDVQFIGESVSGTPILVLDSDRGELLIPLAQEICTAIDVESRLITVVVPDGLLDINTGS